METMLYLRKCIDTDPAYEHICSFAAAEYNRRYGITLESFPDTFIYALTASEELVGCFGVYHGSNHPKLTTEWYIQDQALANFVGVPISDLTRTMLCEVGTRVVHLPPGSTTNSVRASIAMAAALFLHLYRAGQRFALFTADRSVYVITRQLELDLMKFGVPDLSTRDAEYRTRWQTYFDVPRECFGFDLAQAEAGCYKMYSKLAVSGFAFDPNIFAPLRKKFAVAS